MLFGAVNVADTVELKVYDRVGFAACRECFDVGRLVEAIYPELYTG